MPSATDHETLLDRIADLARHAAGQADAPASIRTILAEIEQLARQPGGDTPEPSDIADTANQSL